MPFSDGSCAIIWRYKPTPESSEGAGDASALAVAATRAAALVCDIFRVRFGIGVAASCDRVLVSQAGLVTVAFAE